MQRSAAGSGETDPQDGELELFSFASPGGILREVTEAFAGLMGYAPGDLVGRPVVDFLHPDDRPAAAATIADLREDSLPASFDCRFAQRDGGVVYLRWTVACAAGGLWQASGVDAAELVRLLADRRDLRTRLDLAIGQATAAMWQLDVGGDRFIWEAQAAEILGLAPADLPESPSGFAAIVHPADREAVAVALRRLVSDGSAEVGLRVGEEAMARYVSLRGRILDHDLSGRPTRAVGLLLDVTTEKAMEEQLLRMSASDPLTGTPNRRAFDQAVRGETRRCKRSGEPLSLLMVDIDHFKQFNDAFGHLVGDQALIAAARALAGTLHREGDVLARYGGEEFAVVLPGADRRGADIVAARLLEAVRAVTMRQAPDWQLTVSVATWFGDGEALRPGALLGRADEALHEAKASGRDRAVAYEGRLAERAALQTAIVDGLAAGEFELYYQPIVSVGDCRIRGLEALMRWNRPGEGLIAPDVFIPAAERTSIICDLGQWALRQATAQLAAWAREVPGLDERVFMAVNISGHHASRPAIVSDVQDALRSSGLAPGRLELELTETALRPDRMAATYLARSRALGVRVAIDDFGTGYTSIGELANLPADVLKIDRAFTASLDPRHQSLVRLMVESAHAFALTVVAEGVEDEPTLDTLRELRCDAAQGYLFARPLPAAEAAAWLTRASAESLAAA
jgi:diguanylate cyclase (GGDEF)-like protein